MTKIKELIPIDTRISMLQTCYNTAGSNYQSKSVKPEVLTGYANLLYLTMMKQIVSTESNKIIANKIKKQMPKKKAQLLLKKLSKRNVHK